MKPLWIGAPILGMHARQLLSVPRPCLAATGLRRFTRPSWNIIWDPSVLQRDIIAEHPHVAFTLYDETAIALRRVTGLDFEYVLEALQFLSRALGLWGVYFIARRSAFPTSRARRAGIVSRWTRLSPGPAVVIFEFEPTPRAFAVPLLFLALGLVTRERFLSAAIAASVAFLMHPPTTASFWIAYSRAHLLATRTPQANRPLGDGCRGIVLSGVLAVAASTGRSNALSRVDSHQEEFQRLRASYNWVSVRWWQRMSFTI